MNVKDSLIDTLLSKMDLERSGRLVGVHNFSSVVDSSTKSHKYILSVLHVTQGHSYVVCQVLHTNANSMPITHE